MGLSRNLVPYRSCLGLGGGGSGLLCHLRTGQTQQRCDQTPKCVCVCPPLEKGLLSPFPSSRGAVIPSAVTA